MITPPLAFTSRRNRSVKVATSTSAAVATPSCSIAGNRAADELGEACNQSMHSAPPPMNVCIRMDGAGRPASTNARCSRTAMPASVPGQAERLGDPPAAAVVGRRRRNRSRAAPLRFMEDDRAARAQVPGELAHHRRGVGLKQQDVPPDDGIEGTLERHLRRDRRGGRTRCAVLAPPPSWSRPRPRPPPCPCRSISPDSPTRSAARNAASPAPLPTSSTRMPAPIPASRKNCRVVGPTSRACAPRRSNS